MEIVAMFIVVAGILVSIELGKRGLMRLFGKDAREKTKDGDTHNNRIESDT